MSRFFILIICHLVFCANISAQQRTWTLKACLEYAVANNISVRSAELDVQTAQANYQQAKYNKLPAVSATGSITAANGSTIDAITSNFINQFQFSNSYGVTGSLALYQGNKLNLLISQNALLVKQSELYKAEARNDIQLSVIETYLQALYYKEGIAIAQNALLSSAEEVKQARVKYNNGAVAQIDLADLETQHATNQYNVVAAENAYAQQVLSLKQLLELDPQEEFALGVEGLSDEVDLVPDKEDVFRKALEYLPTVKTYDLQNDILYKELEIARAGYKPTLSLSAGLNTGYTNSLSNVYWSQIRGNFSQSLGLTLSVPIFSKFQNRTNVALARINIDKNDLDKLSASKALYAKIETAWQNAVSNRAQQVSSKVARDNAKLAYELARKKYEFGALTTTELAVSRNSYLNAEQTYLQARYLTVLYRSLLDFYQGSAITTKKQN